MAVHAAPPGRAASHVVTRGLQPQPLCRLTNYPSRPVDPSDGFISRRPARGKKKDFDEFFVRRRRRRPETLCQRAEERIKKKKPPSRGKNGDFEKKRKTIYLRKSSRRQQHACVHRLGENDSPQVGSPNRQPTTSRCHRRESIPFRTTPRIRPSGMRTNRRVEKGLSLKRSQ